ncbi:hypothetical protein RJ639_015864 [Escallonia herrerae]|uniref:Phylloplanin n=1 Tax=Escallonia herrerae TaxID=1293975 RepID=A0AA88VB67_9ASTE|nr:hypothetical protein RJ639_015864 [Escallonia herrerae]
MASKPIILVVSLLAIAIAASTAEAQLGLIGGLLGLVRIQGTLFCTLNGNIGVNGTSTPVFPNALVQLRCGGTVVSAATTNGSGSFSIVLDPAQVLLSSILSSCNLVVNTPLSTCNATLPAVGSLLSPLQLIGNTLVGLLNVANLIPAGFQFLSNLT